MSNVDNHIVSMTFDNAAFQRRLADTIASIDKLTSTINVANSTKGLNLLGQSANNLNLQPIADSVDNISSKFNTMGAVGFSAIQKITQGIMGMVSAAAQAAKEDILGPIIEGGTKRAINIEQAKFQFRGLGIDVQKAMDSVLPAVKGTAYGLDEAAKIASQLAASGMDVGDKMTSTLRGIAGAAAMTGSSFSEIGDIFAQSAALGKVNTMDLQQFATRGLNAAAAVAKQLGMTEAQVKEMASSGQLDFATFADAMDKAFGAHATAANETYTGALANLHAAMSRLGASIMTPKLEQQRDLFNALSPVIDNVTAAIKPFVDMWMSLRGMGIANIIGQLNGLDFTSLKTSMPIFAQGLNNLFIAADKLARIFYESFREIFPKSSVSIVVKMAEVFRDFTEKLIAGESTLNKIRQIFLGFFSVLDIGWAILKGVGSVIMDIVHALFPAAGGLMTFMSNIGASLTDLDAYLVVGGRIQAFFDKLGDFIVKPIQFIEELTAKIVAFFQTSSNTQDTENGMTRIAGVMSGLAAVPEKLDSLWDRFTTRIQNIANIFAPIVNEVKEFFSSLGQKIAEAFGQGTWDQALDAINIGLLGGIAFILQKFLTGGFQVDFSGGLIFRIKGAMMSVQQTFVALQTEVKADAILKIAKAIALIAAALVLLSLIDSAKLASSLTTMGVALGEMIGTLVGLDKLLSGPTSAAKLSAVGTAMIEIAIAMDLLAIAISKLSKLSWEELTKGLTGITIGLVAMTSTTQLIAADTGGIVRAGFAIGEIAVAMLILSEAVKLFSDMSWGEMARGLTGVGVGLGIVVIAMNNMPAKSAISGLGFIEISAGLLILAQAVQSFSGMDWETMGRGLVGVGASLLIIAEGMKLMPNNLPITATGVLILSSAMLVMADAVKAMGTNNLDVLAKGIGSFAVMLGVLVIAMKNMETSVTGAAAMVIVAGALLILTTVIEKLGNMDVMTIVQGISAIAVALTVIGVAAHFLDPAIPAIMGLGVALGAVGIAFALFGVGAMLVAKSFEVMAKSGAAGAAGIVEALKILVTALPDIAKALAKALVEFINELLNSGPLIVRLLGALIEQLAETIIKEAPKIAEAFVAIVLNALDAIRKTFPDVVKTGFEMLMEFLRGIEANIEEITKTVANIIVGFIEGLAAKADDLAAAIFDFIISVAEAVAYQAGKAQTAFIPIGQAFIQGLWDGIQERMPGVIDFFKALPGNIPGWIGSLLTTLLPKALELLEGFITGLGQKALDVAGWFIGFVASIPGWLGDLLTTLSGKAWDLLQGFLQGLGEKELELIGWFSGFLAKIPGWIGDALTTLPGKAWDVLQGFLTGLGEKELELIQWFGGLLSKIPGWLGDALSTLVGKGWDILQGLLQGITSGAVAVMSWFTSLPSKFLEWIPNPLDILRDVGEKIMDGLKNGISAGWEKVTSFLSSLNPLDYFNDINLAKGHAITNLVPAGRAVMTGLLNGMTTGWTRLVGWLRTLNPAGEMNVDQMASGIQRTLSRMVDSISNMDEFNPVITPVLDLSNVKSASGAIASLMKVSSSHQI